MPDATYLQSSFLGGEWSKAMQGRIDRPDYRTAMNACKNGLILESGAWTRRPGFRYGATTKGGGPARLFPFSFKDANPYTMEVSNAYLRMFNGPDLVTTNDAAHVATISATDPAVVQLDEPVTWDTGTIAQFSGLGTNVPILQNRRFKLTLVDTTHFSLTDEITGETVDGSEFVGAQANNSYLQRILEIPTLYDNGIWHTLRVVQAEQTAIMLHSSVSPHALTIASEPVGAVNASFNLNEVEFQDGPYLDPVTTGAQLTPNTTNGIITLSITFADWSATTAYASGNFITFNGVNYTSLTDSNLGHQPSTSPTYWEETAATAALPPQGFTQSDIGRLVRVFSEPADYDPVSTAYVKGSVVKYNGTYWSGLKTLASNQTPGEDLSQWSLITGPAISRWTWGRITGLTSGPTGGVANSTAIIGGTNIGDITGTGGLAAAFDGDNDKSTNESATKTVTPVGNNTLEKFSAYVGKNYSGDPQAFYQMSLWGSNDNGFGGNNSNPTKDQLISVTFNWRAKQTAPVNPTGVATTSTNTVSSNAIVGGDNIGDLSDNGGINAAFNLNIADNANHAAVKKIVPAGTGAETYRGYIGKNYILVPQQLYQATVWGSTDTGFADNNSHAILNSVTLNWRAKQSAPTASNDASSTILGTTVLNSTQAATVGPFQIASIDASTSWAYTWIEVVCSYTTNNHNQIKGMIIGEVSFTNPLDISSVTSTGADGTVLGSLTLNPDQASVPGPYVIQSNDFTTEWNYTWVEIIATYRTQKSDSFKANIISQLAFYLPSTSAIDGTQVLLQILGEPLLYTVPIRAWRMGLFTLNEWPTCGTYHEGRVYLTGALGNRIDGSVVNGLDGNKLKFSPTQTDGTVTEDDAVSVVFNAPDNNTIYWLHSDQQGILLGTKNGEWLLSSSSEQVIGISAISRKIRKVTNNGCANVEPVRTNLTTLFIQKFKRRLMEMFADVFSGRFATPNLALTAKQLTKRGIEEAVYQQEGSPTVWSRCSDGSLIGMTYKRESLLASQGPAFAGWHDHPLGSERDIESVCVAPSTDGLLDTLAAVTNNPDTDVRYVEFLTPVWEEDNEASSAWFVDAASLATSYRIARVSDVDQLTVYGFSYLNNEIVTLMVGGVDAGDFTVADGAIGPIDLPLNTYITTDYINVFGDQLCPMLVGYSYTSKGQVVRPMTPAESGTRTGPALGKLRRSKAVAALLVDTFGIYFGTSFDKLKPLLKREWLGNDVSPLNPYSGVVRMPLTDSDSYDSMACWQISRPYPATVAAISGFLESKDT